MSPSPASLRPDVLPPVDRGLDRRAAAILAQIGVPGKLPKWPSAEVQAQYTGVHGLDSMRTALRFVETLEPTLAGVGSTTAAVGGAWPRCC